MFKKGITREKNSNQITMLSHIVVFLLSAIFVNSEVALTMFPGPTESAVNLLSVTNTNLGLMGNGKFMYR